MGKSHRDNHKARLKRGKKAFKKKEERRPSGTQCARCGAKARPDKIVEGWCLECRRKFFGE